MFHSLLRKPQQEGAMPWQVFLLLQEQHEGSSNDNSAAVTRKDSAQHDWLWCL
jgi:hypothetical protein